MINTADRKIVFFDGFCNLCTWSVDFIHSKDSKKQFYFASLQGATAKEILSVKDLESLGSVILLSEGNIYKKSTAGIRILTSLKWYYKAIWVLWLIPYFIRDFVYDILATNRYRVFGKRKTCRLPTKEEASYFLD